MSIIEKNLKLDINRIVFIGRTFEEYIKMFDLSPENLENMKVLDCAGGACSFTAHANKLGIDSKSCDIAYYHEVVDLEQKGLEDIEHTIEHMEKASGNYVWEYFSSIDALKEERSRALKDCVQDMRENPQHYQAVTLPVLPFENKQFDMTVCAHLLFMYSDRLDYQFHLNSLKELIRVTKGEIRIFPLTDLYGKKYDQLPPGQTLEISEAYIGQYQKLPARVIIHRLTKEQTEKRLKEQAKKEKKKGITYKERSKRLSGINVYITNLSAKNVPTEHIHDLYSLRWQIEILFKTWKSFFQIQKCKEIKKERLECHLYGQLISI